MYTKMLNTYSESGDPRVGRRFIRLTLRAAGRVFRETMGGQVSDSGVEYWPGPRAEPVKEVTNRTCRCMPGLRDYFL